MARKVGQIVRRGSCTWLVRMYTGCHLETKKRTYLNQNIHGGLRDAQAHLNKMLGERDRGQKLDSSKQTLTRMAFPLPRFIEPRMAQCGAGNRLCGDNHRASFLSHPGAFAGQRYACGASAKTGNCDRKTRRTTVGTPSAPQRIKLTTVTGRTDRRPNPDELLRRVQAEERREQRGRLKIFLGYAPRVGKSFRMFDEGRRRRERGQDVVIAAAQNEVPGAVREIVSRLEIVPALDGAINLPAIFKRHPEVCLIDQLAFNNPPGSRNPERWQDVEEILRQGIAVITAVNVQYIREQQAAVERFTGKRAASGIPESFLHEADEIEVVDAPPDVTMGDPRIMTELRELALLLAADVVDRQLQAYLDSHGVSARWGAQERILVCLTSRSNARAMLESGGRNARRFHGALLAAYVEQPGLGEADRARLAEHLALAREMGAEVHRLKGGDFVDTLLGFAHEQRITQLFLGRSQRDRSPVEKLIDRAEDFDVRLFPHVEAS